MRIIYVIGKYITFPGAFLRGFWEHLTCLLLGLPVEHSGYLRADEMCGHIEHILPKKATAAFVSATAPGIMGVLTGLPTVVMGLANIRVMGVTFADSPVLFVLYILMIYVGVSVMCCLHPQFEVAQNLWDITLDKLRSGNGRSVAGGVFMLIPALWTYIGAVLERFSVPVILWAAGTAAIFLI